MAIAPEVERTIAPLAGESTHLPPVAHYRPVIQAVDWHRLDLRYAALRLSNPAAIARLARSMAMNGQRVSCIGVVGEGNSVVLIDGYRRVAALKQLGRDTVQVECADGDLAHALLGVLTRAGGRTLVALEEAYLLRELVTDTAMTQLEIARYCDRDVGWVNRRLKLLTGLPETILEAVRCGQVSTWAAVRILGPLASANAEHGQQLLASLATTPLSTRQLAAWFAHYQRATQDARARMVQAPSLLLNALSAQQEQKTAAQLRDGPEGEVLTDIRLLNAVSARLVRRLSALSASLTANLPPAILTAVTALHPALESLQRNLTRICHHDTTGALPSRTNLASAGSRHTRDQPEFETGA